MFAAEALRFLVSFILRIFVRVEVHLSDPLPPGPFILCANHRSILDPPILFCLVRRKKVLWAATYLFRIPLLGRLLRWSGAHPVQGLAQSVRTMRTSLRALRRGEVVIIFPQGGVRGAGEKMQLRRGAALLAKRSGAPVVPVALCGTERILPVGRYFPRPGRVCVYFGSPVRGGGASVSGMTGRIQNALSRLMRRGRGEKC